MAFDILCHGTDRLQSHHVFIGNDDANILEDLGADSLDVVDMLMTLEEEFNILVPDEDVVKLKTVRAVAQYIEENQN